jgi:hypothetical protein
MEHEFTMTIGHRELDWIIGWGMNHPHMDAEQQELLEKLMGCFPPGYFELGPAVEAGLGDLPALGGEGEAP